MDLSNYQLMSQKFECNLYCNPKKGIIYQEWLSPSYGESYRAVLLELLEIQKENGVSKLIVNGKELGEMDEEDIDWTQNEYSPISIEEGLRFIAFIVPDDAYHAMKQSDVLLEVENAGMITKFFSDVDEAFTWVGEK